MFNLLIAIGLLLSSRYIYKNYINPVSIFSAIWVVVLAVYEIFLASYSPISDKTYVIIGIGLMSFAIGASINDMMRRRIGSPGPAAYNSYTNFNASTNDGSIRYKGVLVLCILTVLVLLPDAWDSLKRYISGDTFQVLRAYHSSGQTVITNRFILVFMNYIVNPFCVVLIPLCAVDIFLGKRKKWLLVFTIIITVLTTFITAGRIQIVYIPLHFILAMLLAGRSMKIPQKVKRIIFIGVVAMFVILNFVTLSRGSSWEGQTAGLYLSGGVPLMDYYVNGFNSGYTLGAASTSGFLRSFFSLLENIGVSYPAFLVNVQKLLNVEEVVRIGGLQMNAYVTVFYYFFIDGGFVGTAIGSIIYGFICKGIYNRTKKKSNIWIVAYCLIAQGLIFSMIRLQFVSIPYCLSFVLIPFIIKKGSYSAHTLNN